MHINTAYPQNSSYKIVDVYPSAFQRIEQPLYLLNRKFHKMAEGIVEGTETLENSFSGICKILAISYIAWPMIICAVPFTVVIDMTLGICEAFYAKYKGAASHQISLILQKKLLASPIQHVVYLIINLACFILHGASWMHTVLDCRGELFLLPLFSALSSYYLAQGIIRGRLPAWIHPDGFNIFINDECVNSFSGHVVTGENREFMLIFQSWLSLIFQPQNFDLSVLSDEVSSSVLTQNLQPYQDTVNRYDHAEFKKFFNLVLKQTDIEELLQLDLCCSQAELQKKYRSWALILHPDKHTDLEIKKVAEILFRDVFFLVYRKRKRMLAE